MRSKQPAFSIILMALTVPLFLFSPCMAQDNPPPLPAIGVEGFGGVFGTYSAYLVNPAKEGEIFGLPSVGYTYIHFGQGRHLNTFGITETLWNRLELGYAYNMMDIGDLPQKAGFDDDPVGLHNFNARLALIHEGDFDLPWMPAITAGVHYKYNDTVDDIDRDLGGALRGIGIQDNDGVDFTLYASKLFPDLPRPVLVNLGLRASEAAHIGLLGFTNGYEVTFEGNLLVFVTDKFLVGGEYRMKPDEYRRIPGLIEDEEDWWTLCACYIVNDHLTLSGGYGHFGKVLNHEANGSWALRVIWEF